MFGQSAAAVMPLRQMPGAPEVGQHGEEILLELGHDWEEIVALKDKGVIT